MLTTLHHELIDSPQVVASKTLAEMHHHRGIKGAFARVSLKTQEKLDVWILPGLISGFLVGQSKSVLDVRRTKSQSHWFGRSSNGGIECAA